ncbi:MAG: MFS transporter [Candidatus Helarchaeota archaeon]
MQGEKSYFKATTVIYLTNLLLGIPGGIGLAILSRFLEYSFLTTSGPLPLGYELLPWITTSMGWALAFLVMSLHVLMKGICSPICGYLADDKGRRYTIIIGGIISLIGSSCLVFSTNNIILLAIIGTLIIGAGRGFFMTTFNVMAGDIGEKFNKVGQTESYCDGLYLMGAILGGATSLILKEDNPINILFNIQDFSPFLILSLIFFIFAFVFIIIFLQDTMPTNLSKMNKDQDFSYKDVLNHENFIPTFMYAFTVEGAESGYIATTLPILVAFFVSPDKSALFTTLPFSLGLGLFFLIAGVINDRKGRKFTATLGCFLILVFSILASFLMISTFLIFIIVFLLSGSSSFVRSTIESTWTDVSKPTERGKTYGIFRFFNELGGVFHPFLMFLLNILFDVPIYFSAILIACFSLSSLLIGRIYFRETLNI